MIEIDLKVSMVSPQANPKLKSHRNGGQCFIGFRVKREYGDHDDIYDLLGKLSHPFTNVSRSVGFELTRRSL